MSVMASQITSIPTVCSGAHQRKHQSSALLAFVRGIHRWPADSPHKGPVTQKTFPFDDVIMDILATTDDIPGRYRASQLILLCRVVSENRVFIAVTLTHCGLVTPYGDIDLGQHWVRQWLVFWRHQAITWTNVYFSLVKFCSIHLRATPQRIPRPLFPIYNAFQNHKFWSYCCISRGLMSRCTRYLTIFLKFLLLMPYY